MNKHDKPCDPCTASILELLEIPPNTPSFAEALFGDVEQMPSRIGSSCLDLILASMCLWGGDLERGLHWLNETLEYNKFTAEAEAVIRQCVKDVEGAIAESPSVTA